MRAEFDCDYCGRIAQVVGVHGSMTLEGPADWLQIPAWEISGSRMRDASWEVNGDLYQFGRDRQLHFCSARCAWWAMHRSQPFESVTIICRGGELYGPQREGWEIPPDPKGDSR